MYYLGVQLCKNCINIGIVKDNGELLYKANAPSNDVRTLEDIAFDIVRFSKTLLKEAKLDFPNIKSMGLGISGFVNNERGTIDYSEELDLVSCNLRAEIREYINLPTFITSIGNCYALAESVCGEAKAYSDSVTLDIGNNIESGFIKDGKLFIGFDDKPISLSHMVVNIRGIQCKCERVGCWKNYITFDAFVAKAKEIIKNNNKSAIINKLNNSDSYKSVKTIFEAAKNKDEVSEKLLFWYLKYLSEGIINIINFFSPQVLVISGEIANEEKLLNEPLKKLVYSEVYQSKGSKKLTEIKWSKLGQDSAMIGAAMFAINEEKLGLYKDVETDINQEDTNNFDKNEEIIMDDVLEKMKRKLLLVKKDSGNIKIDL